MAGRREGCGGVYESSMKLKIPFADELMIFCIYAVRGSPSEALNIWVSLAQYQAVFAILFFCWGVGARVQLSTLL